MHARVCAHDRPGVWPAARCAESGSEKLINGAKMLLKCNNLSVCVCMRTHSSKLQHYCQAASRKTLSFEALFAPMTLTESLKKRKSAYRWYRWRKSRTQESATIAQKLFAIS